MELYGQKGRDMSGESSGLLDSLESLLHAQIHTGEPEMKIDSDSRLRHKNFPGAEGSLYLGDVTDTLLRVFGPHEPPLVTTLPGLDQQQWEIVASDSELTITIQSKSYWGFGLVASCFLNIIHINGPLERRARLIFDLASALGRNPWEAKWKGRFGKISGRSQMDEKDIWEAIIERGRADLSDSIEIMRNNAITLEGDLSRLAEDAPEGWSEDSAAESLTSLRLECDMAEDALHDKSAAGVERALSRAEVHLIEADPRTEVAAQHESAEQLLESMAEIEADEIDLTEKILVHEELPEEFVRTQNAIEDDDIPFVDLSEEE